MKNFVITIARGFGSGGKQIGLKIASDLNIRLMDKELLQLASIDSGISEELFALADEKLNRHLLMPALESTGKKVDIAFIYVSDEAKSYHSIEKRVQAILSAVAAGISQEQQTDHQ